MEGVAQDISSVLRQWRLDSTVGEEVHCRHGFWYIRGGGSCSDYLLLEGA